MILQNSIKNKFIQIFYWGIKRFENAWESSRLLCEYECLSFNNFMIAWKVSAFFCWKIFNEIIIYGCPCVCVWMCVYAYVFAKVVTCGQKFATFTTARNYTLIVWTNTHAFKHNTYTHTQILYSNKPKNHLQLYYIVIVFTLTFVHRFFESKKKEKAS